MPLTDEQQQQARKLKRALEQIRDELERGDVSSAQDAIEDALRFLKRLRQ